MAKVSSGDSFRARLKAAVNSWVVVAWKPVPVRVVCPGGYGQEDEGK